MIYLDNNATTIIDPLILDEIHHTELHFYGNPSSIHSMGQLAKQKLLKANRDLAAFFGVKSEEIFFTSGATEGLNMVLRGFFNHCKRGHLITTSLEHEAVYQTAKALEIDGIEVTYLDPEPGEGAILPHQVRDALRPTTRCIALMWANNETGALTPLEEIAELALRANIPLLVDGVAYFGKEQFFLPEGVTACCLSGHKIHAGKGIGVTILKKSMSIEPIITGGAQQWGKRGGTENLPAIAGFALACELIKQNGEKDFEKIRFLRDYFEAKILKTLSNASINFGGNRVSNVSNLSFEGISGETMLIALDQAKIAASHGSACSSGALEPSRVLLNMGLPRKRVLSSVRFSLSRMTNLEEIEEACKIIKIIIKKLN